MTTRDLFCAIGDVREDYILDAAVKSKKKRALRLALAAAALVACAALLVGPISHWWMHPVGQTHEQLLRMTPLLIGDRMMNYTQRNPRTQWDQLQIDTAKKGDVLWTRTNGSTVYRIAGRADIAEVLLERADGELTLWEFDAYSYTGVDRELLDDESWYFATILTDAEKERISFAPYTIADVLRDVYAATSADDIVSVRFEKTYANNTELGRSIRPKTVTLRGDDCAPVWDILVTLVPDEMDNESWNRPAVPLPDDVLPEQTRRSVTVKFRSGATMEFSYNPAGGEDCGLFWGIDNGGSRRCMLTVEQNHTLIDLANISFAPTPIPETKPPEGTSATATVTPPVTAVPPDAPETIPE